MGFSVLRPFAISKLHLSLYLCTASGYPPVQFAHSNSFFPISSEMQKVLTAKRLEYTKCYNRLKPIFKRWVSLFLYLFAISKLHLSRYLYTASGYPSVQFAHSNSFFPISSEMEKSLDRKRLKYKKKHFLLKPIF